MKIVVQCKEDTFGKAGDAWEYVSSKKKDFYRNLRTGVIIGAKRVENLKKYHSSHYFYSTTYSHYLAKNIHHRIFGKPQTHKQWADSFNTIGKIMKEIC